MLKKLEPRQLEEFSIWDWRPVAADTFLSVMRTHSVDGKEIPQVIRKEIGPGEHAHHYQFEDRRDDLIIVFARGGRTTAFKRRADPPEPPHDGTSGKK